MKEWSDLRKNMRPRDIESLRLIFTTTIIISSNIILNTIMVIIRSTYRTIDDIDLFVGGSLEQV